MKFVDRIKDRFRKKRVEEALELVAEAAEEERIFVPNNRADRRAAANWAKRRGAGYTRSYRKGRTQRHA